MANEQIHQHFEQFISKNASARYEDWIAELHPENAEDGLLGLGHIIIDARFYDKDNEYLKFWNSNIGSDRTPVMVASTGTQPSADENGSNASFHDVDLLSGEDEDSQSSPPTAPRRTVKVSPEEDLMKFD